MEQIVTDERVIAAVVALLGIIAGSVLAYADMRYTVEDACRRVETLERQHEEALAATRRVERKVDRLLLREGLDPDAIR